MGSIGLHCHRVYTGLHGLQAAGLKCKASRRTVAGKTCFSQEKLWQSEVPTRWSVVSFLQPKRGFLEQHVIFDVKLR